MTYSMMVRPTLLCVAVVTLLFALLTPTTTASPVSPTPATTAASSSVFLSAYSFQADGVHTIGYSFDPSTGSTTLLRSEMREVFPTPKDKGSLRRDDTQYLTTINNLLSVHSFAPTDDGATVDGVVDGKKAKILLSEDGEDSIFVPESKSSHIDAAAAGGVIGTNFYGYSLFMNTSTLIQPVPFSVTRLIYDPTYDIVMGVSSVHQADGQWNVTFVMMEYNGDFYSYYIPFMSMLLPNPVGSGVEDACRPEVAYDSHFARMTLHWPGSSSTTGGVTTGQLFTWNITYKNFTPSAKLISTIAWPSSSNNQLSSVFGLTYSADIVGGFAYASGVGGSNGVVVGVVDPLTGDDLIPPVSAQFGDYDRPRMLVTKGPAGVALLVIEYTQPWRFTSIHLDTSNTVASGVIQFPADKKNNDDNGQVVLGIHNWN